MARYTGPVCRLCRRDGLKLFLKGTRCDTPKCEIERRENPPGQQHQRRGKLTDYGQHLREKQKVKHYYGVLERQFRKYFEHAVRGKGNTGDTLMTILERRLDNIVHRLGFAQSRAQARQVIRHGHITVNGRKVDIPSFEVRTGDVIRARIGPRAWIWFAARWPKARATFPIFYHAARRRSPKGSCPVSPPLTTFRFQCKRN